MMLSPPSALPLKPGDVLAAKYRVERVLGAGGMGVVVAAMHLELEQRVALKFLQPGAAMDPLLVERFLREARASVRLKSAHVARTFDTGRLDDGCPFIVMEYLEGRDLSAELSARGPLPIEEAASYVLQTCEALAEAHALGMVHRDLKPANLFLAQGHDGRAHVKILDFGISKLTDGTSTDRRAPALTTTHMVFGSPAYMSPEQMRSSRDVDARSDIWSVGVVLYELLTGVLPFEASTPLELGLKASQEAPTPPSALRPDLSEALERLIVRCLEKAPERRFSSIAELAASLAPFARARDRGIADRVMEIGLMDPLRSTRAVDPNATTLRETELALAAEDAPGGTSPTIRRGKVSARVAVAAGFAFAVVSAVALGRHLVGRPVTDHSKASSAVTAGGEASWTAAPSAPPAAPPVTSPPPASESPLTSPDPAPAPPPPASASPASASPASASPVASAPRASASSLVTAHHRAGPSPTKPPRALQSPPPTPRSPPEAASAASSAEPEAGRFFRVRE